jgi:hypothetical protein
LNYNKKEKGKNGNCRNYIFESAGGYTSKENYDVTNGKVVSVLN